VTDSDPLERDLKQELLDELRKQDSLKKDLLRELQPVDRGSSFSRFIQHPAILLILGFVFTSGIGAGVTYFWQKRERIESQRQADYKREIEEKHAIAENILRTVAETNTAVEDLVKLYFNTERDKRVRNQMETERLQYWQTTSRDWRVNSKIIQQKLKDHFKNQDVQKLFQEIVTKRFDIGQKLDDHRYKIKTWNWQIPECEKENFRKGLRNTLGVKEAMLDDMRSLVAMLNQEIREEENH